MWRKPDQFYSIVFVLSTQPGNYTGNIIFFLENRGMSVTPGTFGDQSGSPGEKLSG